MKLGEVHQQAIQARMTQIGAENYDRLFMGVVLSEVADSILFAFAPTEALQRDRGTVCLASVHRRRPGYQRTGRLCSGLANGAAR